MSSMLQGSPRWLCGEGALRRHEEPANGGIKASSHDPTPAISASNPTPHILGIPAEAQMLVVWAHCLYALYKILIQRILGK